MTIPISQNAFQFELKWKRKTGKKAAQPQVAGSSVYSLLDSMSKNCLIQIWIHKFKPRKSTRSFHLLWKHILPPIKHKRATREREREKSAQSHVEKRRPEPGGTLGHPFSFSRPTRVKRHDKKKRCLLEANQQHKNEWHEKSKVKQSTASRQPFPCFSELFFPDLVWAFFSACFLHLFLSFWLARALNHFRTAAACLPKWSNQTTKRYLCLRRNWSGVAMQNDQRNSEKKG